METKKKKRHATAPAKRTRAAKTAPERRRKQDVPAAAQRRRKSAAPNTPDRAERQRRIQQRRKINAKNPPGQQRVIRPPREEVPNVIYTAPKPMRRGVFVWKLISMAAVVAAVFLGLSVFFRVDTIAVAGADKYTPWMIREASGVNTGDALLSISEAKVASRIQMKLPYVDEIKVGIRRPGTVEIQVTELQVTYSIEDEAGGWWLISSSGRAVEPVSIDKALGYTRIDGLTIRTPEAGEQIRAVPGRMADGDGNPIEMDQTDADQQLAAVIGVMTGLEKNRIIGRITRIDVSSVTDIRLEYPQLLTVRLGDDQQLDYKISYLAAAVKQLEANQSGELDLTFEYTEDAIFTPAR